MTKRTGQMESRMRRKTHVRFGERVGGNDQPKDWHRASDPTPRNPEPSEADLVITERLLEAGKILEIPVLDHVISATRSC